MLLSSPRRMSRLFGTTIAIAVALVGPFEARSSTDAEDRLDEVAFTEEEPRTTEGAPLQADTSAMTPSVEDDPRIIQMTSLSAAIAALLEGTLEPSVSPASLFDFDINDEDTVAVEAKRLSAVLLGFEAHLDPIPPDTDMSIDSTDEPVTNDAERIEIGPLLAARLELDRARLSFLELDKSHREALLWAHQDKRSASHEARQTGDEARARAVQAEHEQKRALGVAQRARTEAARMVAEEEARLLGVAKQQAEMESALSEELAELEERAELVLGLRRRVKELLSAQPYPDSARADELYTELRTHLRVTRDRLSDALFNIVSHPEVPGPGPERLLELPVEVSRGAYLELREKTLKSQLSLESATRNLLWERAGQLYLETRGLNDDRLALLPSLSPSKRSALTKFQEAGWQQAMAEFAQVTLVMRYHSLTMLRFVSETAQGIWPVKLSYLSFLAVAGKWLLLLAAFVWWRRRADDTLERWRNKALEDARRRRLVNTGWIDTVTSFALGVRVPLEWLILVLLLHSALPGGAEKQLEVQLLLVVLVWSIGGAVAVSALDAFARQDVKFQGGVSDEKAALRLRSLRVVGRTVVAFGMILGLTARMVGQGTIYNWVWFVCRLASVPLCLLLVAWWRSTVFARVEAKPKKTNAEKWIIENKDGAMGFVAATFGGGYLVVRGVLRFFRTWISQFDITRRALAYFFRRGLNKLASEGPRPSLLPLSDELFKDLDPERKAPRLVPTGADQKIERIVARIREKGGGVFAIVGERGLGKTTTATRVADELQDVDIVHCPLGGIDELAIELARIAGLEPSSRLMDSAAVFDTRGHDAGVVIDDAHRLIRPIMGGLEGFDLLLDAARRHSSHCMWVLAMDEAVWRFFERARGIKPVFDDVIFLEPWREEEIAELLRTRTSEAGMEPDFTDLLVDANAYDDEVDKQEALERVQVGYFRLLWNYASGNPGVALHMWRKSLGASEGGKVFAKFFQTPDTRELEELPDSTAFVLRAAIQLEAASSEDIAKAAMLSVAQVENALRYGLVRGYFNESAGRHKVTWAWYRAITDYLRRRHLLATHR